jgi:hypothetical protein
MQLELSRWFGQVRNPRGPVMGAERHFESLIWSRSEHVPGLGAHDELATAANSVLRWIQVHPCPNEGVGAHLMSQIVAYGAIADTVRTTVTEHGDGNVMVARLGELRGVIDEHAEALDQLEP